jgi:hypothetical protein
LRKIKHDRDVLRANSSADAALVMRANPGWSGETKDGQAWGGLAEDLFISITFRFRHNLIRTTSISCIA